MAKRIGKYKVGTKENALSAFGDDGGTIPGSVTLSNATVKLSGLATVSESNVSSQYMLFSTGSGYYEPSPAAKGVADSGSWSIVCIRTGS